MSARPALIVQLDAMHRSRGGDWYYRTSAPGRALAELDGVHVINVDQAHRRLATLTEQADVLIVNGVCSADLLPLFVARKRAGRLTVFEINDDVQSIQASNPLAGFFAQPENLRLFRRLARSADAVQYSVPELERLYGSLNRCGHVFPNQMVVLSPHRAPAARDAVSIGWGGSAGHLEDIAEIAPALIAFVAADPRVTLCLMCSDRIWQLFDALPSARKRRTPVGSIDDYYAFVSRLDIGLAPNQDKGFNRARSDVKFLEYAAGGAVPVVPRLTPYLDSVKHGENGFFYDTVAELIATLAELVSSAETCNRVRERAHHYVRNERLQSDHAARRLEFYAELLPRASSRDDAARAFAEAAALEGAEVAGRHVMLAHTRYETLLHDGLVALQSGRDGEHGATLLRKAAELEPSQALPELFLGAQLDREPELLASLAKNPRSIQARMALGSHYLARGEFRAALERFLTAAELAPGYEMPFLKASLVAQQMGARKEAEEFQQLAETLARAVALEEVR